MTRPSRVLAAMDKFRGTISALDACVAVAEVFAAYGIECRALPLGDGGEGTLDVLGGPNRASTVQGPDGTAVEARWRLHNGTAVIEMAEASGLLLAGGRELNDPVAASSYGTGQLIDEALVEGARRIIVCAGGSATTDGGWGAIAAIKHPSLLNGCDLLVACDVATNFVDASRVFAPQKGADQEQIYELEERLLALADRYLSDYGVDVRSLPGAGAGGGLGGGLAALGALLVSGFDLVAREVRLEEHVENAELVVGGEGRFDATSMNGKVVGSLGGVCHRMQTDFAIIAGHVEHNVETTTLPVWRTYSLVEIAGVEAAMNATDEVVRAATHLLVTELH